MHTDRKEIFHHYLKNNFIWDLIGVIPFLISLLNIPYIEFALLIRVTRVKTMVENLEEVLNLNTSL